jgi:hypothetical protein
MAKETQADQKRKLDEDEEQSTAKDEPMGSVAAAVPRDAGSAVTHDTGCNENSAPPHKGGPATLVAGRESHQADQPKKQTTEKDKR